MPELPEV
jgi:formamidopyrimidine-DNA glycosylase